MIQVFLNLLINAVQHVPEGGHLRLATEDSEGALLVRVEDDGPGIPETERERIFDPCFTRRDGGVGLGLTNVRQIVEAHGTVASAVEAMKLGAVDYILRPFEMTTVEVDALEQRLIREALRRTGDNKSAAARLLEISERPLWYKL